MWDYEIGCVSLSGLSDTKTVFLIYYSFFWFTNKISVFKLISCILLLLLWPVSKTLECIFSCLIFRPEVSCPPPFIFFFYIWKKFSQNLWRQGISKFSGSVLLKHFVKLWTGAEIHGFIKFMAVTGLAVVERISNSVSSWGLNLLILLDYPLPSSSSTCTEIQDMNVKLVVSWRQLKAYLWRNHSVSFGKAQVGDM